MSTAESDFSYVQITLPDTYPYVLLISGLLCVECLVIGMIVPGAARHRVFNDKEVEAKVSAMHLE